MATDLETAAAVPPIEDDSDFAVEDPVAPRFSTAFRGSLRKAPQNARGNYNIRMTFDRGELEIMSPSPLHEGIARLLGTLIHVWRLKYRHAGSQLRDGDDHKRRVLERGGFEPDNCYYVQHEPQMWDKNKINFKVDPPPEMAIREAKVTRKLLDKTDIHAAFGVPEL